MTGWGILTTSFNVLIVYDSHGPLIDTLAEALAEGVARVAGARPVIKRVQKARRRL